MAYFGTRHTHIEHEDERPLPLIFLSLSSHDYQHPIFRRLLKDLKSERRIRIWHAPEQLAIGDSLFNSVQEALSEASFHVIIVSNSYRTSQYTNHELHMAYTEQFRNQKGSIIPVLIDKGHLPELITSLSYIDLTKDYKLGFQQLIENILMASERPLVSFQLDTIVENQPIIEITGLVGSRLIEYFARHPEEMKIMPRRKFEELIAELFSGFGYDVELTQQTRDGGRDIIAIAMREVYVKYLIECKRPDPGGYVGIRPVRELYGVKTDERATKAILATTAHFSPDALLFFENHRWELEPRDYNGLTAWIHEYIDKFGSSLGS